MRLYDQTKRLSLLLADGFRPMHAAVQAIDFRHFPFDSFDLLIEVGFWRPRLHSMAWLESGAVRSKLRWQALIHKWPDAKAVLREKGADSH
jgi:hypothetical protein